MARLELYDSGQAARANRRLALMAANECSINGMSGQLPQDAALEKARHERRLALIVPREHGAWGLLLVPLVTGTGVALRESHNFLPALILLVAALALFWVRTPAESLLGTSAMRAQTRDERLTVTIAIAGLTVVAAVALGSLLWAGRNRGLWLIGAAAGSSFVAQAFLKRLGRAFRMLSEMVGVLGLTSAAPAAYYVVTGRLGATAWMLWLANLLFAGDQIHYVQFRIHTARLKGFRSKFARGWIFAVGQFAMTAVLGSACWRGLMPWAALIAFLPILFRGWFYFFQKPGPLVVRRLGWNELAQAVSFCVLFIAAFVLAR
jgi:hypothetical protein